MRMSRSFIMIAFAATSTLVACGDDGGKPTLTDAPIDVPKPIDAPAAAVCTIPATIPAGGIGTMAMPVSGNFIIKSTQGSMPIFFGLRVALTMDMKNDLTLIVPRPAAGFTAGTFAFDPNPQSTMPLAIAFMDGNITNMMAEKTLYATNGSITFTAIGQQAGNPIRGTVSMTNFKEVDNNGAVIAGGCASTLTSLQFFLTQMTTVTRNADGTVSQPESWKVQVEGQQPQILTIE